jgi:hypothetical protein
MAETVVYPGNIQVVGRITCGSIGIPANTIDNLDVVASAGIEASKLEHNHCLTYAEGSGTTAVDKTVILHKVKGTAGTLKSFQVDCVSACTGAATVTVDLQNDGVSVLDAVVTLDSSTTAASGTIVTPAVATDDKLTIVINATSTGTDAAAGGLFVELRLDEDYSAT